MSHFGWNRITKLWKQKVTVTSVAVATIEFLFVLFFARAGDFACVWARARAFARVSRHGLAHFQYCSIKNFAFCYRNIKPWRQLNNPITTKNSWYFKVTAHFTEWYENIGMSHILNPFIGALQKIKATLIISDVLRHLLLRGHFDQLINYCDEKRVTENTVTNSPAAWLTFDQISCILEDIGGAMPPTHPISTSLVSLSLWKCNNKSFSPTIKGLLLPIAFHSFCNVTVTLIHSVLIGSSVILDNLLPYFQYQAKQPAVDGNKKLMKARKRSGMPKYITNIFPTLSQG